MTPEIAKLALQFLQRTQITGQEAPQFMLVVETLVKIAQPKPEPTPDA